MKTYSVRVDTKEKKRATLILEFEKLSDLQKYLIKNQMILIEYRVINKKIKILKKDIINFTQNLKILLESGIGISQALEIMSKQKDGKLFNIIHNIHLKIIEGNSLYVAFSIYKNIFGESYLNMLLAGEESGRLIENLEKIYEKLIFEEKIKKKIKEATLYPTIILIFTVLLIIFILTFVFPNFIEFFKDTGVELPFLTRVLITISQNFITIILGISIFIIGIFFSFKKINREIVENLRLSIPFYGDILKRRLIIEFCKNFSIMNEAGMEVLEIFEILKKGDLYLFQQRELSNIEREIKMGSTIYEAFYKTGFFNATQLYLIEIGEKSGSIERAFGWIATTMESELEYYLFKMTSLLEPVLLLILGVIVGIIILGLYLPIFNISQII
ncbi:type II secretion system F family protein [Fusobacterium sp.]|uniref:type II secretion system F family protein n=1 Tax=Fusobacterium sp. TaxID=68766 RepID=UPI00261ED30D|nr:type II secretion system F family protein [Fusobacterium sp.]